MRHIIVVSLLVLACSAVIIISATAAAPAVPTAPQGTFPPVPPFKGCMATPVPSAQAGKPVASVVGNCRTQPDGRSVYDQGTTTVPIVGAPAITPSKPTNDPAQPAFTEADVRSYVATHPQGVGITNAAPPVIAAVTFETTQNVNGSLHSHFDLGANRLLCVVKMTGTFAIHSPRLPPDVETRVAGHKTTIMYYIFDAHTGNFLAEQAGN